MTRGRSLLPAIALVLLVAGVGVGVRAPAIAGASPACVVTISRFAFNPNHVSEGDTTSLHILVKNCTDQQQNVTLTRSGTQPPGCPAIDPIGEPLSIAPHGTYAPPPEMLIAPPCAGVETRTATISGPDGGVLSTRTARLAVSL